MNAKHSSTPEQHTPGNLSMHPPESMEERFHSLAQSAPVMIWMSDEQGHCIFVNTLWKTVTGKTTAEETHRAWQNLIHPDDRQRVSNMWAEAFKKRAAYKIEFRLQTHDHNYIKAMGSHTPMFSNAGDFIGFIGVVQDITITQHATATLEDEVRRRTADLIKKNEELRRSEERYHKMIAEVQDYAIILIDRDGVILNWNKGAQHIKGYTAQEAVGMNFRKFYTQADLDEGLPWLKEKRTMKAGASVRMEQLSGAAL
jgi:PAS domain S-box-containing protein